MRRDEPVYYVRFKQPPQHTTGPGALMPPLQAAAWRYGVVKQVSDALASVAVVILRDGPPFIEPARFAMLKDQLFKATGDALVQAAGIQQLVGLVAGHLARTKAALDAARAGAGNKAQPAPPAPPEALDVSGAVLSFVYEESEKKTDQLKLTVENNDLRWLDTPLFEKGTRLVVAWGYVGHLVPPREVVVQKVEGNRTLTINCAGKGQVMNKVARTRTFNNMTRAEVVRKVAVENGFGPEAQEIDDGPSGSKSAGEVHSIESQIAALTKEKADILFKGPPTKEASVRLGVIEQSMAALRVALATARRSGTKPKSPGGVVRYAAITQAGQTDAQFLKRLADLQGFEFYIDFDGLHWHPRRFAQRPIRMVQYYLPPGVGDILDFNVNNDVLAKPATVAVKGIDPLTKQAIGATGSDATTPRPVLSGQPELSDQKKVVDPTTGETRLVSNAAAAVPPGSAVLTTSEPNAAAAKTAANGMFTRAQQSAVKIDLDLIGDPGIVCKTVLMVQGLGKRLSGRYFVSEITHDMGPGKYTMKAKCRSDGTNKGNTGGVKPNTAAQQNNQTPPVGSTTAELTPKKIVDSVTGETRTVYTNTAGRDAAEKAK